MSRVYTITQLNNYIKLLLDADDELAGLYVKGELSNYKAYPSGHHYFTMKDAEGALKCVMFKSSAVKLRFKPENGMSVIAMGRVQVYPRDGVYQLYVSELTPDGVGDLYVAFEQLKEKLFREGLFDEQHKKPLPQFPSTIAVITSSAGAAVQDIIRILKSRWPMVKVVVMPVRVQGSEAPPEIVKAIEYANEHAVADLIITGRGGGSIEDLWAFNDERVARAIFKSDIPVISAVGHEPDVTIADFVADVRAATPSNAAEIAVPDRLDVLGWLRDSQSRLTHTINRELKARKIQVGELASRRVLQSPKFYIDDRRIQVDRSAERLLSTMQNRMHKERERYGRLVTALDTMSPLKVLGRGYAVARNAKDKVIKGASDVKSGEQIKVRFQKDEIDCVVK